MNINVVIGNPPYRNDLYKDFTIFALRIYKNCMSMIIPAKWHTDISDKYNLSELIFNSVKDMTYIMNAKDIFDIQITTGVCYFICNKKVNDNILLNNICKGNKYLTKRIICKNLYNLNIYSSIERKIREINNKDLYRLVYEYTKGIDNSSEIYCVQMNNILSGGGLLTSSGQTYVTEESSVVKEKEAKINQINRVWFRGTIEECESFKSYIDTKLIRFIIFLNMNTNRFNYEIYKHLPDPVEFNHKFSDEELYEKYKLNKDEIEVIEYTIKKRST